MEHYPITRSRTHLCSLCKLKKTTNRAFQARNRDTIQGLLQDGQSEFESRPCIFQRIDRWIAGDSQFGFDSVQFGLHSEVERKDIAGSVDRRTKSADHRRLSGFSVSFRGYGGSESHASYLLEWLCVTNFPNNHDSLLRMLRKYLFPEDLQEMSIPSCIPSRLLYSSIVLGDVFFQMELSIEAHRLHVCGTPKHLTPVLVYCQWLAHS
jgi:hypothetical protein